MNVYKDPDSDTERCETLKEITSLQPYQFLTKRKEKIEQEIWLEISLGQENSPFLC